MRQIFIVNATQVVTSESYPEELYYNKYLKKYKTT